MSESEVDATIIFGVHNGWNALKACLESVLELEFERFEVIVVDDASTDDTPAHSDEFCRTDARSSIRVLRSETNLGPAGARNLGIDAARGRYVCFTDSDCAVDRQRLSELVAPLEDPQVAGSCGRITEPPPSTWLEAATFRQANYGREVGNFHEENMTVRRELVAKYRFDDVLRYGSEGGNPILRFRKNVSRSTLYGPRSSFTDTRWNCAINCGDLTC